MIRLSDQNYFFLISIFFLLIFSTPDLYCQGDETLGPPDGQAVIINSSASTSELGEVRVTATSKSMYYSFYNKLLDNWQPWELNGNLNYYIEGREIVDAHFKEGDPSKYMILLDDGSVYIINFFTHSISHKYKVDVRAGIPMRIDGDAIYVLTSNSVFVNRDTTTNVWNIDTTGLRGSTPIHISLDTLLNVYLATTAGLYKQGPNDTTWNIINSLPASYTTSVFVDNKNRIYVSDFSNVYMSTDGGQTWNTYNTGLTSKGVTKFGADLYNNIYAIAGGMVYRSDGGTNSWVRIDKSISDLIADPISQFNSPYNDVGGDSVIFLATNYGLFKSTDQGNTWSENNQGIKAATIYGFAKSSTRNFVSTHLGLFYQNQNDTVWTKSFPKQGYITGNVIYNDKNNNIYTVGAKINTADPFSVPTNWKSTDNGSTWFPDTAGLGAIKDGQSPTYFVDENGIQHFAYWDAPAKFYQKAPNSSWAADTSGYGNRQGDSPNIFGSDNHGYLYVALTVTASGGLLYKRPITGGTWVLDTVGLQGGTVYAITSDAKGNPIVGTYENGVYRRVGNVWTLIPSPSGHQGDAAFVTAVDQGGAIFAGFSSLNGVNFNWHGVYYTTNNGASWTYAGLDSISVRSLIAYGDSIYAVTYNDGEYILTRNGATKVNENGPIIVNSYNLYQNYPNPFNPTTAISYQLSAFSHVTLKVYDVLGKEIKTLVNEYKPAGKYTVNFDASKLASGVYFYQLKVNGYVSTKKLVVLK